MDFALLYISWELSGGLKLLLISKCSLFAHMPTKLQHAVLLPCCYKVSVYIDHNRLSIKQLAKLVLNPS